MPPKPTGLPPSGFGSALRRVREEKGLTQKQLGEGAEIHPNTIARLERGEMEPSWQMVIALAKALGVDCTAFAGTGAQGESGEQAEPEPAPVPQKPKGKGKKS